MSNQNIIGCDYGNGFAEVFYGSDLTLANRVAFVDGSFAFNSVQTFVAKATTSTPVGFGCFPAIATCYVEGKGKIPMENLKLGDPVLVEGGIYEPIYSFGHRLEDEFGEYLQITTVTTQFEASKQHLVFVKNRGPIPASWIEVGDQLLRENHELAVVISLKEVIRKGVFAPFTPSGKIVVDGVLASSFVTFDGSSTIGFFGIGFSYHWLSHSFEFPHRLICYHLGRCPNETYDTVGVARWAATPARAAESLLNRPYFVRCVLLLPIVMVLGVFNAIEAIFCNPVFPLAAYLAYLMIRRRRNKR